MLPSRRKFCVHHSTMHQFTVSLHSKPHRVYVCLAVTCHLHFWQNDRDLLRAIAVTQGWNGYRNKSQHMRCLLTFLLRSSSLRSSSRLRCSSCCLRRSSSCCLRRSSSSSCWRLRSASSASRAAESSSSAAGAAGSCKGRSIVNFRSQRVTGHERMWQTFTYLFIYFKFVINCASQKLNPKIDVSVPSARAKFVHLSIISQKEINKSLDNEADSHRWVKTM